MILETSSAERFDVYELVNVLWFCDMEEVGCDGNDLVLNPLFKFEQMKELEHCGKVRIFGSANNGTCKSICLSRRRLNLSNG